MLSPDMPELCVKCHDKSEFTKKDTHGPAFIGMCMACHEPHQADQEKLLREKTPGLCFECHRQSRFNKKNVHPPVAAGECMRCHTPHSSKNRNILRAEGNEICKQCHTKPFEGSHAVGAIISKGHRISGPKDPVRKGRRFGCTSCHDPHSSDSIKLFRYPADSLGELCVNCHKK
jgi:predicted CXXCH cytochrome family protein